jgi:hypothetical protein
MTVPGFHRKIRDYLVYRHEEAALYVARRSNLAEQTRRAAKAAGISPHKIKDVETESEQAVEEAN